MILHSLKLHQILNDFHNLDYDVEINSVIDFDYKIGNMKNILSISNSVENSSSRDKPPEIKFDRPLLHVM